MGDFRKFSTMSDPTAFGVAMAACSIFFIIFAWNEKKLKTKIIFFTGVLFMLLAMGYSGTRTANIMMAGGAFMFILLTLNIKATRTFAIFATIIFLFLLYGPYVNPTIIRFRTSFIGSEDESYKVREVNRAFIQPYIYSHPIGGGLGTTGASGLRFSRGHYLAGFPPDSGYLRKALETGWIGLGLVCILYFVILKYGVQRYFRCKDPSLKIIYAASIASLFSFYLAEFAQEAIGQITDIVIYYPMIAMMLRMQYFKSFGETQPDGDALTS
jgi:cell division protein FtsW (lipid II flippase)